MFVEELARLREDVKHGLEASRAVRLVREQDEPGVRAVTFEGGEEALRLNHVRPAVRVVLAVDEQDRFLDPVGVVERGHLRVHVRGLPQRAFLGLEPERGERPVVRPRPRDGAREQVRGVREEVRRHERAVRVPADGDPPRVRHAPANDLLHRGPRAGDELLDVRVVGLDAVFRVADDG